jgi:hypothetical protein
MHFFANSERISSETTNDLIKLRESQTTHFNVNESFHFGRREVLVERG